MKEAIKEEKMKNAIKNVFLMGIGAASLTKKKAEETVKVFVKKGN